LNAAVSSDVMETTFMVVADLTMARLESLWSDGYCVNIATTTRKWVVVENPILKEYVVRFFVIQTGV